MGTVSWVLNQDLQDFED